MKKSPIDILYYNFCEEYGNRRVSKQYRRLTDEALRYYHDLMNVLTEEQKEKLIKFANCNADMEAEEEEVGFREGFIMGIRIAAEAFLSFSEE